MIGRRQGKGGRYGLICRYCAINARYTKKNVKIYKYSNVFSPQNQAFTGREGARRVPGPGEGVNGGATGAGGVDPKLFFQIFFHLPQHLKSGLAPFRCASCGKK